MPVFVDTNIFIRFLIRDIEKQAQAAKRLFNRAEKGEVLLVTSSAVVFEVIWTLSSFYKESKDEVIEKITSFLEISTLEVENKELIIESLLIWQEKNIGFIDAYNYLWSQKHEIKSLYSFDKHFDDLPNIKRLEP